MQVVTKILLKSEIKEFEGRMTRRIYTFGVVVVSILVIVDFWG